MIFLEHESQAIVGNHLLVTCQFEITWKCNEACVHCYQRVGRKLVYPKSVVASCNDVTRELTTDEVLRILEELRAEGCFFVAFTGGDPLVRRDFRQIVQRASDLDFVISIMTNGLRIDEAMADFFTTLNLMRVEISLYGACAETHDAITQVRGSFDKTLRAVRLLVDRAVRVYLKQAILRPAFDEIAAVERLAASFGESVEFVASPEIVPRNDGSLDVMQWALTNDQLRELFDRQRDIPLPRAVGVEERGPDEHASMCGIGDFGFNINPLGQVYSCVSLPFVCGDLRKQSVREVWNEGEFFRYLKQLRDADLEGVQTAANGFRCPGASYVEFGDLTKLSTEARRMAAAYYQVDVEQQLVQIG